MAAGAPERTPLRKRYKANAGAVKRAHTLKGAYISLDFSHLLHCLMEGAAYNLALLLAGELVEVHRIARNAYCKVGVSSGVVIRLNKGLPV